MSERPSRAVTGPRAGRATTGWVVLGQLLAIAVFAQSLSAGLLLSGETWGRTAHTATAYGLVVTVPIACAVAAATVRHHPGGRRLTALLLALAFGLAAQTALGLLAAGGQRLLWAHIPVGVAMVGLAAELPGAARVLVAARSPAVAQRAEAGGAGSGLTSAQREAP